MLKIGDVNEEKQNRRTKWEFGDGNAECSDGTEWIALSL